MKIFHPATLESSFLKLLAVIYLGPCLAFGLILFGGCTTVPIQGTSPAAATGQDLNVLAAEATQVWADYKAGRVNYAYAVAKALYTYQTLLKTSADVKALVKAWSGDGTYAEKLARIFAASNAPPETKANALANGVLAAASNEGP